MHVTTDTTLSTRTNPDEKNQFLGYDLQKCRKITIAISLLIVYVYQVSSFRNSFDWITENMNWILFEIYFISIHWTFLVVE